MLSKKETYSYLTYGAKCNSVELEAFLVHLLQQTDEQRPTPVCIWGKHGIGKTELVQELARKLDFQLVYLAPAQFEEMGDLVGMPKIVTDNQGREVSRLMPPDWVPNAEGPGILLLDDVNRADDRILRGIMQLLQQYALVSWQLPKQWHIILTANPDGGDYSVTPMDDAIITRMIHVTMEFEVKSWARWADAAGIDARGINFVLSYPEVVNGQRTTPRTLVQFFREIQKIGPLEKQTKLVKMLGDACLDAETTAAFISFVQRGHHQLPGPEDLLNAAHPDKLQELVENLTTLQGENVDLLSVLTTRLLNYIQNHVAELTEEQLTNLRHFLLQELLPNDLRLALAQELMAMDDVKLRSLMANPEVGKLLLMGM
ncbi:MAG: hypothetical protein DHS20C18_35190 [Saprospiraceae bacterium]|nr:MAG: hypothetical protein DHS20C18_35190 [Saprospiraceae bacterium]